MSFEASPVRRALDHLLDAYPMFDLVSIDWQLEHLGPEVMNQDHPLARQGVWALVSLGQPSEHFDVQPAWAICRFAILKKTGALHSIRDGAVSDDPIWTP